MSLHLGQATFVENHGSIFIVERYGGLEGDEPASLAKTAIILSRRLHRRPHGNDEGLVEDGPSRFST